MYSELYEYQLVPTSDMEEYLSDENKFCQLPWEDAMYVYSSRILFSLQHAFNIYTNLILLQLW